MSAPPEGNRPPYRIDGLQYCNWSEKILRQIREGGLDALHVTVCYHETLRETIGNLIAWNRRFEAHPDLILKGLAAADVETARATRRTAIFLGLQNCLPIEDDIGLVVVLHDLGIRFMQLTYNNQSLLGGGCYEPNDSGVTRMGREVIAEMNRVGLVVDLSHSGERTCLEAIDLSARPVAMTHANPASWHAVPRNKSDVVLRALAVRKGMLGLSLYPHHLSKGSATTLAEFSAMAARTAELIGVDHLAIGSDLCQDQPDSVVQWMRQGRWTKTVGGTGAGDRPVFPLQPDWFSDNRDFARLANGLEAAGFNGKEVGKVLGGNWHRFFAESFGPMGGL
jgi:microsomal dipeptidase-like Zn-dependent dipeptidase